MATLVSPGVSVTITDESQYGSAGPGTIPLIVIATASNKLQPGSTTAIAPGTIESNAGQLWLITSQRDAITTFGAPVYYSSAGTVQNDNQLNELGLFTLYEYLGIANQAYVIRADLDLSQLVPSSTEPVGAPSINQNWLDLSNTTWGIFKSNGNPNPAFSWQAKTPAVINSATNLEIVKQGYLSAPDKITSGSVSLITTNGTLQINGIGVAISNGDSLSTVASKINGNAAVRLLGISASIFSRIEKFDTSNNDYGTVYNIRLVCSNITTEIDLTGSTSLILTELGLGSGTIGNVIAPASFVGTAGDFSINTLQDIDGLYKNEIWEKIPVNANGITTNWWFKVGSNDSSYPGWGWREAAPRTLTGSASNPTFTIGDSCTIKIGNGSTLTVTVTGTTLESFVSEINSVLDGANENAVATIYTVGSHNYLQIINFDGTNVQLNDNSNQDGTLAHPFKTAGMQVTNTYWANVTGTISNPTYVAATVKTDSATVVSAGTGYTVGNTLTVIGGTFTAASILTVASIKAVSVAASSGGTGYSVNDTITFSGAGYTTSLIITVTSIGGSGDVTGVLIAQAGQFTGSVPINPATPTSTSGSGLGATFNITWGINTVTVTTPGSYTVYPINPVVVTGGSGSGATFNLTSGFLQSTSFSIDPGTGTAIIVHVPAAPNNTLNGVINEINTVAFPNGPIVASKVTSGTDNYLKLTNTNGTAFIVEDIRGLSLNDSGIPTGVTFGRRLVYQGWQPSLTPPSSLEAIATDNIWINTTPGNQGANYVVKTFLGDRWATLNIRPNTGTIPMYSSTAIADAAFGGLKQIGSTFVMYNSDNNNPPQANQVIYQWSGSSWDVLDYTPSPTSPFGPPADGTYWYNTSLRVDIMVNTGTQWVGYRNAYPATDPNGVILSSVQPVSQSTLAPLVDYDLWLDTAEKPYPVLRRYNAISATWELINNTDQSSAKGILFADARPNATGTPDGSTAPSAMVLSNYIDPDAPNPLLYPAGLLLFDTRYSTYNVKVFRTNYLTTGSWRDRWVTASGNAPDGAPYMGPDAQRQMVVRGIQSALASNEAARAEQNFFNLLSAPGYPEALDEMITLNTDKKNVAFIVGDTPSHLQPTGTAITAWATNAANAAENGPLGLTSSTPYAGLYYPWGLGTNLDGSSVIVPPSMMALRTIAFNDQVAYPWFAPAGYNRGLVTGVSSVGFLNSEGDYVPATLNQGQRDVLYTNKINPIAFIPGRGLVVYGQKTLNPTSTALDRINVARLICYLSYQLDNLAKPFLFEPNDVQTRANVTATFKSFMSNLVAQRAVYDYAIVCDTSNNTPARIDRNELWIDVAIKPTKAIEFIYIPIRILNTGDPLPGGGNG